MNAHITRFVMVIALAFSGSAWTLNVWASALTDEEATKVRGVIVAQIEAFADDDADRAFETATPSVREAIGSSGKFLAMVRGTYPMVYRPSSITFHKPETNDLSVLQPVEIRDGDDKSWLVLFALERQPDSSWRISGCVVSENRWKTI